MFVMPRINSRKKAYLLLELYVM
uniref:Uncharacterized protein n=1 Tax=Timema genevievae TaxID=629358 RepID=A0A7R9PPS3_TIMGE|nr:unnamed protein product [Timema genevievae]